MYRGVPVHPTSSSQLCSTTQRPLAQSQCTAFGTAAQPVVHSTLHPQPCHRLFRHWQRQPTLQLPYPGHLASLQTPREQLLHAISTNGSTGDESGGTASSVTSSPANPSPSEQASQGNSFSLNGYSVSSGAAALNLPLTQPSYSSSQPADATQPQKPKKRAPMWAVDANAATAVARAPADKLPHRWKVVLMMAVSFVLCNMDKVNMSVAIIPMAGELGWSATERGLVSSSFFWGYALTQIPAGWIATYIGGAKVLLAGVLLWSLGTMVAPPAAQISIWALCATRVLVGLGEGFAPSAATAVLAKTVPATERARAVTTVWGGLDVGSAIGLLLSGPLIRLYGWPSVFYLFAVLGFVWCILWPLVRPDKQDEAVPEQFSATASVDESDSKGPAVTPTKVPWKQFFSSAPVWALTCAHFCFNWGYYTLLAWLPSYFELALGLNVEKSSFLTLIPYIAMTMMTPFVGPIADGMVKKGTSLTFVRKFCQGVAFVGPAICMILCALLTPTAAATAKAKAAGAANTIVAGPLQVIALVCLLSMAFALGAWSRAGLYCNHQDLSPKYASALLGITNTAGALPGVLGVTAAGYLLDTTSSWALALFYPTALCQLFGAFVYSLFASSEKQSWSAA